MHLQQSFRDPFFFFCNRTRPLAHCSVVASLSLFDQLDVLLIEIVLDREVMIVVILLLQTDFVSKN